jgi:hypothetical protein
LGVEVAGVEIELGASGANFSNASLKDCHEAVNSGIGHPIGSTGIGSSFAGGGHGTATWAGRDVDAHAVSTSKDIAENRFVAFILCLSLLKSRCICSHLPSVLFLLKYNGFLLLKHVLIMGIIFDYAVDPPPCSEASEK